ncbi:glyoxalase [Caulobacter radicis]|uniref:VOC family protein n=1 Tax=Caulobacter radicis TaxID=2172650 RepID=UPI000D57EB57|nr:VOC family protein [Caulobacter radicis]PVM93103.1 glyoxalase [Caulobacter radicis]
MRMIFVNLPVADLDRSKAFFEALGFSINPQFSDETAACVVVSETIFVMLLTHDKFRQFITGEISDAHAATEVLTCLSAESREEVDDLLAKALANGGKAWKPIMDMGPMYGASFQDPDGHVWELMYMDMAAMQQDG